MYQEMSTAKRVIKNTGFLYAKMGITMFISLYTTRLVLNALGASDFGIFNIVGGAIAMLGFLNAAMAGATVRFMSYTEGEGNKEKQKQIFNISFVLHLGIGLILGLILLIVGYFFFNGILNIAPERIFAAKVVYGCLIVSTMFTVMTVPYDAVLNARENMLYYSIVGIIESIFKLIIALIIVYYIGDKLILYGILMAIIPLVTMFIMRVYCHYNYEECTISIKKYWNRGLMKEMTGFAGWNLLGSGTSMASQYGQGILMNHFFGTAVNASQGIANQISGQLGVFSAVLMKALNPVITKQEGAGNNELMKMAVFTGSKFIFYLRLVLYVPFIILMEEIFTLWLNNVPPYAIIFGRLLLIRDLLEHPFEPFNIAIYAKGKIRKFQLIGSIFNIIPILLGLILFILKYGPEYIYLSFILTMFLKALISLIFYIKKSESNFKEIFINVLKPMLIVGIFSFMLPLLVYMNVEDKILKIVFTLIISITSFFILVFYWGLRKDEKLKIKEMVKKLKYKLNY